MHFLLWNLLPSTVVQFSIMTSLFSSNAAFAISFPLLSLPPIVRPACDASKKIFFWGGCFSVYCTCVQSVFMDKVNLMTFSDHAVLMILYAI